MGGRSGFPFHTTEDWNTQRKNIPVETMLHTSVTLATLTSGSGAHSSEKKKCSRAKRLWVHSANSSDYCSERVCRSLWARQRGTEKKVGQGKRGGQPQLSASLNVLTVHLNISLCHELFVSPNMRLCLWCVCAKGWKKAAATPFPSTGEPSLFLSTRSLPAVCPSAR